MMNLLRAEWQKISGNRIPAAVFVGIYPRGALMLLIFAGIAAAGSPTFRQNILNSPPIWTEQLIFPWVIINSEIGRLLLVGFAADVFGGEYQRGMWKNLLQRRERVPLILSKFIAMAIFVMLAFLLMSIIIGVGVGIITLSVGAPYLPALADMTPGAWETFLKVFGAQAAVAFTAALIAASYAALGGIFTRSILGAVAVGTLLTLAEQGIALVLSILSSLLENPGLLQLYKLTPGYNLANISSWAQYNTAFTPLYMIGQNFSEFSAVLSTIIVLVWLVGLIALTVWLVRLQDILQ